MYINVLLTFFIVSLTFYVTNIHTIYYVNYVIPEPFLAQHV